jgi:hypothetical protein
MSDQPPRTPRIPLTDRSFDVGQDVRSKHMLLLEH